MRSTTTSDRNSESTGKHREYDGVAHSRDSQQRSKVTYALWTVQGLLALLFVFAGGMKLAMPIEMMTEQMTVPLPGWFLQFIGVCELLGGLGLVLPGLLRIRPGLTPLAAAGLAIIMIGATTITVMGGDVAPALVPFVVGLLATFVVYGRIRLAPRRSSDYSFMLQPAH